MGQPILPGLGCHFTGSFEDGLNGLACLGRYGSGRVGSLVIGRVGLMFCKPAKMVIAG